MELAINNEIDRYSLAIDAINRIPDLLVAGAYAKEKFRNLQINARQYAYEYGIDNPEVTEWRWS
jgi:xylulose-5-phosphate/fructose-6-phosphate phosphoketolase